MVRITATLTLKEYYTRTLRTSESQKIIKKGLYHYVRHPGYFGLIVMWLGAGLSTGNYILLALIFCQTLMVYVYRIKNEEAMLIDHFGDEYLDYKKSTKKLFPLIY